MVHRPEAECGVRGDLAVGEQGQWLTTLPVGASITQAKLLYWGLLRKRLTTCNTGMPNTSLVGDYRILFNVKFRAVRL